MHNYIRKTLSILILSIISIIIIGTCIRLTHSGLSCPDWPLCYTLWMILPSKICIIQNEVPYTYMQIMFEWGHRFYAGTIVSPIFLLYYSLSLALWIKNRKEWFLFVKSNITMVLLLIQIILGGITVFESNVNWSVAIHLLFAILIYFLLCGDILYLSYGREISSSSNSNQKIMHIITLNIIFNSVIGCILSTSGYDNLNLNVLKSPYSFILLLHILSSIALLFLYEFKHNFIFKTKNGQKKDIVVQILLFTILSNILLGVFHKYMDLLIFSVLHQMFFLTILTLHAIYYWRHIFK